MERAAIRFVPVRKETPWGTWDHIPLDQLLGILDGLRATWWIAGGYAIDAFAGSGRRPHDDIDFSVFSAEQRLVREHLDDWDPHYGGDPSGSLQPWPRGVSLPAHVHDIWVRRDATDDWRFQLMLNPGGPDEFVYRRDARIRMPLAEATFVVDGVRYLAPEVQLLFKSRAPRAKDERDFTDCLPLLDPGRRRWLAEALALAHPDSAWLSRLER